MNIKKYINVPYHMGQIEAFTEHIRMLMKNDKNRSNAALFTGIELILNNIDKVSEIIAQNCSVTFEELEKTSEVFRDIAKRVNEIE